MIVAEVYKMTDAVLATMISEVSYDMLSVVRDTRITVLTAALNADVPAEVTSAVSDFRYHSAMGSATLLLIVRFRSVIFLDPCGENVSRSLRRKYFVLFSQHLC